MHECCEYVCFPSRRSTGGSTLRLCSAASGAAHPGAPPKSQDGPYSNRRAILFVA
jgi:hypothetical protein